MSDTASATSSKTDLLPAKAKPISDGGSTSGIIQVRRGKKTAGRYSS